MVKLRVSKNKQHLETEKGEKFFYLADTVWSAFTNATLEEWNYYLDYRKSQGFNVLQINLLQQWDASETDLTIKPFAYKEDGSFDFYKRNDVYFERAEKMVAMAVEKGFVPALVLLWCNYVPDTWGSQISDVNNMPLDVVEDYVKYVGERFSKYDSIYVVSGDTDFPTERATEYYSRALHTIKQLSPHCITTLHIRGRLMDIPDEFLNSEQLDFYMFQSGHNIQFQNMSYKLAEEFNNKPVKRPSLNSEPCYEQMGYSRNLYGRFNRFDVRKAAWQSLLSGASAGVTYGAHGIWSWHKQGKGFGLVGEAFDRPYDWKDALKFEGAWDYAFAKKVFKLFNLYDLQPQNLVLKNTEEIRVSGSQDLTKVAIYVPVNTVLKLDQRLEDYEFTIIDLEHRRFGELSASFEDDITVFDMHGFESDVLIIGEKKL
ncbi:apiosidase-like domain-containing protein [Neobacillus sp. Marseille-QA0830]